ncbi:MAG: ABC transporter permease [Chloroflexi bacterium]|nr:ABC transporter permease [Chloroflexota bacterium]
MVIGLVVGALFAAATAAGIPQYGRTLEIISMRAAVEDVGPFNTNFHITTSWVPLSVDDNLRSDNAVFSAVDRHVGDMVIDTVRLTHSRLHWWGPYGEGLRTDELASQASFQYIEHLDDHVVYVTGVAPTDVKTELDGETVIEVAVYGDRAMSLRIEVGDVIDSQAVDRGTGLVRARMSGTFDRLQEDDPFWMGFDTAFLAPSVQGREQPLIMFPTSNSLYTTVAEADEGLPATYDWFVFTDKTVMADKTIAELENALEDLTAELEGTITRPFILTEMKSKLASMKQRALFGSIPLLLMALLILGCVGFYLTMAAGLLARRRVTGYMMLRSRGFNIKQHLGIHILEAAIVSVPAAAIAPLLSFVVIGALGYLPTYRAISGDAALPVEFAISEWIWSFGAAAGVTLLITVASSFWDRSTRAASRSSDSRPIGAPWFQRYYVDAMLVGLSGILWWELGTRSGVLVAEREGEFTPDLSLLAAPILIVIASSLVALRIFPIATRFLAGIAVRSSSTAVGLGLASVARRPFFHGWPMLAFALAISTGIVAGSVVSTLARSSDEQVFYSTGADIHVTTTGSIGQVDDARLQLVNELEFVDVASPALRTVSTVGTTSTGTNFTLLAVDPIDFQRVAWFRDDFTDSDATITQLVDRLAVRILPEPIELPTNTTNISIWSKVEPITPNHEFWLVVRDGVGISHTVNFGEIEEGWRNMSARFPNFVEPVAITSIQTFLQVGPDSAPPSTLYVDDLVATTGDGSTHLILDFDTPDLWTGLPTAEGEDTGFTITPEPGHLSGLVSGDSGFGIGNISLGRGSNHGIRGIYRRAVDRPIPMIASESFMSLTNAGIRRPFLISVQGGLVPVEVIDSISYFPTLDPSRGAFAVVDIDATSDFVELRGRRQVVPNELFASLKSTEVTAEDLDADLRSIFRLAHIDSRARRINDTFVDPVAVAGWRGMSVMATAVAAIIILMAYAVFLAAYARRTSGDSALMLALGASRRDYWVSMVAELSPAIMIGILVGLGTGIVVSSLMVGSMAHTGTGERLLPPFLLQTNWALPLVTIGAIFTIVLTGVYNSVRSFHRIQIARMAREGFSAAST